MNQRVMIGLSLVFVCASFACSGDDDDTSAGSGGSSGSQSTAGGGGSHAGSGAGGSTSGTGGHISSAGTGGAGKEAGSGGDGAGTGDSGTAGSDEAGSGGSGGSGEPPDTTESVLERNKHASRDGHFVQAGLTRSAVANMERDTTFAAEFDGDMWASPLYLENGPDDKGVFFAVTTGNDVYALDETTGDVVWNINIGSSPTANGVNCGNIHPLGIIGTPIIDTTARTIYVAGAVGTDSIMRHEVHALSVDDGNERDGWPVNVSDLSSGDLAFPTTAQNQRSALSLVNGILYVAYGGHVGDCGPYHGWVVGIDSADPTQLGAWASLGRGEGIWASGGMASDGESVFAITGNSTSGASSRDESDSEEVVRITGLGELTRNDDNLYFPMSWRMMDSQDADFGSSHPLFVTVPGATPSAYVVAIAKDGHMYLLDRDHLGGMGGHVVDFMVSTGAMSIHTAPAAYTNDAGVHVLLSTDSGGNCPSGGPSGKVVMSVLIPAGDPPSPDVEWCAALDGTVTAPIVTTTDGKNEAIVWYMSGDRLVAVDGDNGEMIFDGGSGACPVRKWTSPIAVKGRVIVGGDNQLCAWSLP